MPLEVIPAIDLRAGKAIRLQGDAFGTVARVAEDAVKLVRRLAEQGASRLHIMDTDGARMGSPQNVPVIREIRRAVRIPLQVGGGLRTRETAERLLSIGVERVVIDTTTAARDDALMLDLLHSLGEKVVVKADSRDGLLAVEGWTTRPNETVLAFGQRMVQAGARRFLFTVVSRDEMRDGVDADASLAFVRSVQVPVQIAGIAGINDIEKLATVQPEGVESVIIGRALTSGALDLADALRFASASTG